MFRTGGRVGGSEPGQVGLGAGFVAEVMDQAGWAELVVVLGMVSEVRPPFAARHHGAAGRVGASDRWVSGLFLALATGPVHGGSLLLRVRAG